MQNKSFETTNEKLDSILLEVEELVGWAEADRQSSLESGAKEQAQEDMRRFNRLTRVEDLLKECRR